MKREMYFVDPSSHLSLQLPVTPKQYTIEHAREITIVDMQEVGQVALPGLSKLFDRDVECFFPAQRYAFLSSEAVIDPQYYIDTITGWIDKHTVVRFVISGTKVNIPVLIGGLRYGEQDGTNDVYAVINMREYRDLEVSETYRTGAENKPRAAVTSTSATTYTVVAGDTLWAIAQKFYGDGSLAYKLASCNGISNPSLIYPGQTLNIPDKAELETVKAASESSATSTATAVQAARMLRLTITGPVAYFGTVNVTITTPGGERTKESISSVKTLTLEQGSHVIIKWYSEGGHSFKYGRWNGEKISGTVSLLVRQLREDSELYIHWVR